MYPKARGQLEHELEEPGAVAERKRSRIRPIQVFEEGKYPIKNRVAGG